MKNIMLKTTLSAMALAVGLALAAAAQQTPAPTTPNDFKAKKLTDATWYEIRNTEFKPGKMDDAMKIIHEVFEPAAQSAGLPSPVRYHHIGGQWDLTSVFTMEGGVEELNWEVHPDAEKWMNALAQQCGGVDKAKAVREQYSACVARGESNIVFRKGTDGGKAAKK